MIICTGIKTSSSSLFLVAENFEPKYVYAMCAAPLFGPLGLCFDSFSISANSSLIEHSIMENYSRNIELNYGEWQMSDRNWDDEIHYYD